MGRQLVAPVMAVAAPEKPKTFNQWYQPAGKGLGFYTGDDGYLYVDNMRVEDIRKQVKESPFYLYSKQRITSNYTAYKKALEGWVEVFGTFAGGSSLLLRVHRVFCLLERQEEACGAGVAVASLWQGSCAH